MQNVEGSPNGESNSPPVRRGPGRPPGSRNKQTSPPASSSSPTTPRQWAQLPPVSNQNGTDAYVPPHLHPAYRGRGRPPLSLGRKMGQGPPVNASKKPNLPTHSSPTPTSYAQSSHQQPPHSVPLHQHKQHQQHPPPQQHHQPYAPLPQNVGPSIGQFHNQVSNVNGNYIGRPRNPLDGKEPTYLAPGASNRLLLSLKSGIPSHISWALSRLTFASMNHPDALVFDLFPGMIDALMQFARRLVHAINGDDAKLWDPRYWEQPERELDGLGVVFRPVNDDSDGEDEDSETEAHTSILIRYGFIKFQPDLFASHQRILDHAVAALLILRNTSLIERNERTFLQSSRAMNAIICNILALPNHLPFFAGPEEWNEWPGLHEIRLYALDILEVTRSRLHIRKRAVLYCDRYGNPIRQPNLADLMEANPVDAEVQGKGNGIDPNAIKRSNIVHVSDHLFSLLVWYLHTTTDRSVLLGCLRCLGALAADERNEKVFIETDVAVAAYRNADVNEKVSSPGILRKCLSLLPLTQDQALLEATLDCLYQVINLPENCLRLASIVSSNENGAIPGNTGSTPLLLGTSTLDAEADEDYGRGIGDVRSIVRFLARDLIYGRVVWDRTHQLSLHPALHSGIPSAVNIRRREREEVLRRRKRGREGEQKDRQRRLSKEEWLKQKDLREPDRLRVWMKTIYESKDDGEVTQMEFWTTYSQQFGPYSQLGGPHLLPAAEVIRSVSNIFPGALAMVLPDKRFIVRGVQPKELDQVSKFECRWKGCSQSETDTFAAAESHIRNHVLESDKENCQWAFCTFTVPDEIKGDDDDEVKKYLQKHIMTHLPETDEEQKGKEEAIYRAQYLHDVKMKTSLKSQSISTTSMPNGARLINGPTALMPNSFIQSEWRRVEQERQDARRRKTMNLPTRGTIDMPDYVTFHVTRTPMDPQTSRPIGIASTAALILRSLARNASNTLMKAGARQERKRNGDNDSDGEEDEGESYHLSERFGFPMHSMRKEKDMNIVENGDAINPSISGQWAIGAAMRIMDSLIDVEDEMMQIASENDILCPTLNEALHDLIPEPGESVIDKRRKIQKQEVEVNVDEDEDADGSLIGNEDVDMRL